MDLIIYISIVPVLLCVIGTSSADPCVSYIELNDTALTTNYIAPDISNLTCQTYQPFKWYRYTGTDDGLLTNQCPTGLQCGSDKQIWINDTFPSVEDGERSTAVCIHSGSSCCEHRNSMKMKNCTDFMVYFYIPTPACVNYCFQSIQTSTEPITTVHTEKITSDKRTPATIADIRSHTTTTDHHTLTSSQDHKTAISPVVNGTQSTPVAQSTTTNHKNNSDDNGDTIFGLKKWIVIVIGVVLSGVVLAVLIATIIHFVKSRHRTATVNVAQQNECGMENVNTRFSMNSHDGIK